MEVEIEDIKSGNGTDNSVPDAKCSRCEGPLNTVNFPHWCKACRAKYQREYQALRKQMSETRGFAAGVSAFRDHAARLLWQMGPSMINAADTAQWLRKLPFTMPQD